MMTTPSTANEEGSRNQNLDLARMTYREVIFKLSKENQTILHRKESTVKKVVNAEQAITFSEIHTHTHTHTHIP